MAKRATWTEEQALGRLLEAIALFEGAARGLRAAAADHLARYPDGLDLGLDERVRGTAANRAYVQDRLRGNAPLGPVAQLVEAALAVALGADPRAEVERLARTIDRAVPVHAWHAAYREPEADR